MHENVSPSHVIISITRYHHHHLLCLHIASVNHIPPRLSAQQLPTRVDDSDAWSRPSTLGNDVTQQQQQFAVSANFLAEVSFNELQQEAADGYESPGAAEDVGAGMT